MTLGRLNPEDADTGCLPAAERGRMCRDHATRRRRIDPGSPVGGARVVDGSGVDPSPATAVGAAPA